MEDLTGKVAVVTGGASGIGLATARLLAAEGAQLVLADVEDAPLAAAANELDALGVQCDVSVRADVDRLADAAFEHHGAVHIVFNNAGVAVAGPTVEMSHADWEWLMAVNLWGPIHGVEAFLPRMVAQGTEGHVLFTASFAGLTPNGLGPYVTKYGVVALAEVLQKDSGQSHRCVSAVSDASPLTSVTRNATARPSWAERTRRSCSGPG
jgi:NAD(P)-dependent dehydrogenase (short-subunit alcohol dehydrogenase family)